MKISVLTPSFNSVGFLEKAVQSVLAQAYPHWEHIVVDGGSQDGTLDILQKYPHLRWVSEKDRGQSDAMNKAFAMASGDLIVYLNADDYFYTGTFEQVAAFFREKPEAACLATDLEIYHSEKQSLQYVSPSTRIEDILDYRQYRFPLNPVSYFYRPLVQKKVGPFPLGNHHTMDYWFLLRAYQQFEIHHLPIRAGCFVMSEHNKSNFKSPLDAYRSLHHTLTEFLWVSRSAHYWSEAAKVLLGYEKMKWQTRYWKARMKAGRLKNQISIARR